MTDDRGPDGFSRESKDRLVRFDDLLDIPREVHCPLCGTLIEHVDITLRVPVGVVNGRVIALYNFPIGSKHKRLQGDAQSSPVYPQGYAWDGVLHCPNAGNVDNHVLALITAADVEAALDKAEGTP